MDANARSLDPIDLVSVAPNCEPYEARYLFIFRDEEILALRSLESTLTLGRAPSATISLRLETLALFEGQVVLEGPHVYYRCLQTRRYIELPRGEKTSLGQMALEVDDLDSLLKRHKTQILAQFQQCLRNERDIKKALTKLEETWTATKPLPRSLETLLSRSVREAQCLSPVEDLLRDSEITDILISDYDQIFVERKGRLEPSHIHFVSAHSYHVYVENLLSQMGRFVGDDYPYCDFVLADGSRGHFVGEQVTGGQRCLSIRKIRRDQWTLDELLRAGMLTAKAHLLLRDAMKEKKSIVIAGATGSGKTSLMRALLSEVPDDQRLITLEDTPEIMLDRKNRVSLYTRPAQGSSLRAITLRELVRQSLRMRPDRLVIGEVRGEEALDLLHALNTGHSGSLCTLHANSPRDALYRLEGLVRMAEASLREELVREWIVRSLHLVLFCSRNAEGQRVLSQAVWIRGQANQQILLEQISL